jgi:predicted oxidoreductase
MKRFRLAPGSPEFSAISFGTWRLIRHGTETSPSEMLSLLHTCLDLGITTIDTAEIYGTYRVEERIGEALQLDPSLTSRFEFITKAGIYAPCEFHPERRTSFYNSSAARLVRSAEKSLRFLGLETLDLFLVHRPDWFTHPEDTAAGLNRLLASGKARSVGVSNYTPSQFDTLSRFMEQPLVTNQIEFSPFHCDPVFDGTLDQCLARGIRPMAWSPTGGGRLFQQDDEAAKRFRSAADALSPKYHGATADQLCCAWILSHPASPQVISGTTRADRLSQFAGGAALTLEREDWYALTEAARGSRIP